VHHPFRLNCKFPEVQSVEIEVTEVADGYAEGRLELGEGYSSNPQTVVARVASRSR